MEARDSGICAIREVIYSQCFDEIIRQITINCAERGYLLVRVRDEVRMMKKAYKSLYDSSIAYGMKKALVAEQSKADMQARIQLLEKQNRELEGRTATMEEQISTMQKETAAEYLKVNEAHEAVKKEIKTSVIKLKFELDKVLSLKINL